MSTPLKNFRYVQTDLQKLLCYFYEYLNLHMFNRGVHHDVGGTIMDNSEIAAKAGILGCKLN